MADELDFKNVYIITKEGKSYTKEGIEYVHSQIEEICKDHNMEIETDFNFQQGAILNKPEHMIKMLENDLKRPEKVKSYLVYSGDIDGICVMACLDSFIKKFVSFIKRYMNDSTYDLLAHVVKVMDDNES